MDVLIITSHNHNRNKAFGTTNRTLGKTPTLKTSKKWRQTVEDEPNYWEYTFENSFYWIWGKLFVFESTTSGEHNDIAPQPLATVNPQIASVYQISHSREFKICYQLFKSVFGLMEIHIVSKAMNATCLGESGLLRINFPRVKIKNEKISSWINLL